MNFKEFRLMCSTSDNYFRERITVKTEPDNISNDYYHPGVDVKVELLPVIEYMGGRIRNKKINNIQISNHNNIASVSDDNHSDLLEIHITKLGNRINIIFAY